MMECVTDQPLGARSHLAVLGSNTVGIFFDGETTHDPAQSCPFIDTYYALYGERTDCLAALHACVAERRAAHCPDDLAINCAAFCIPNQVLVAALAPRSLIGAELPPHRCRRVPPGVRRLADPDWPRCCVGKGRGAVFLRGGAAAPHYR